MNSGTQILTQTLFIIGGISTVVGFIYALYKIAKRIDNAIGVDQDGRSLSDRMEKVEYQLWPNNGKSLADRVKKVEDSNTEIAAEIRIVKDLIMIIVDAHQQTPEAIVKARTSKRK